MNLNRIFLSKKFDLVLTLSLLASIAFLIIRSSIVGLADTGTYLDIGKLVFIGENPYNYDVRTGSLGTVILYMSSLAIPDLVEPIAFQLLNIAGLYIFLIKVLPLQLHRRHLLILSLFLLFSSPVREMLICHQITGIVLGLISLAFGHSNLDTKFSKLVLFSQSIGIAIASDLKPHLAIGGILIVLFYFKNLKVIFYSFISYTSIYGFLYFYTGANLHWHWLNNIKNVDELDLSNRWNDVSNIYPILDKFVGFQNLWYWVSLCFSLLLIVMIGISSIRGKLHQSLVFWAIWPVFSNYSHLYDIILLTIFLLVFLFLKNNTWSSIPVLTFLIIPQNILNVTNLILISILVVVYILAKKFLLKDLSDPVQTTNFTFLLVPLFYILNGLDHSPQLSSAYRVVEIFLLSIFPIIYFVARYNTSSKSLDRGD